MQGTSCHPEAMLERAVVCREALAHSGPNNRTDCSQGWNFLFLPTRNRQRWVMSLRGEYKSHHFNFALLCTNWQLAPLSPVFVSRVISRIPTPPTLQAAKGISLSKQGSRAVRASELLKLAQSWHRAAGTDRQSHLKHIFSVQGEESSSERVKQMKRQHENKQTNKITHFKFSEAGLISSLEITTADCRVVPALPVYMWSVCVYMI